MDARTSSTLMMTIKRSIPDTAGIVRRNGPGAQKMFFVQIECKQDPLAFCWLLMGTSVYAGAEKLLVRIAQLSSQLAHKRCPAGWSC